MCNNTKISDVVHSIFPQIFRIAKVQKKHGILEDWFRAFKIEHIYYNAPSRQTEFHCRQTILFPCEKCNFVDSKFYKNEKNSVFFAADFYMCGLRRHERSTGTLYFP